MLEYSAKHKKNNFIHYKIKRLSFFRLPPIKGKGTAATKLKIFQNKKPRALRCSISQFAKHEIKLSSAA